MIDGASFMLLRVQGSSFAVLASSQSLSFVNIVRRSLRSRRGVSAALCGIVLVSSGLVGCATVPGKGGLGDVQNVAQQRLGLRVEWMQGHSEDSVAQAYVARVLSGEVPVDSAIQIGLLRNKRLQADFEDLGIAQADLVQAGLFGNPVVSAGRGFARGGGPSVFSAGVALPFIDLLQRPLRTRVARQVFVAEGARMGATVLTLAADIRMAYVEAQAAVQMVELRRAVVQALDASVIAAQAIHAAGNLSDLELAQERAQASNARLELFHAEGVQEAMRAELERVMGVPGAGTWTLSPRLLPPQDSLATTALLAKTALGRRLDLRAARADAEASARQLGLTRSFALLPDGTIGPTYEREPDGTFAGGAVSFALPLLDRGQARIARNRAMVRQATARHDALVVEIGAEVRALAATLAAARAREAHLRLVVLPLRRQVVTESQKFVNAMEQSVFTLLLAKQAEIDAGQAYVETLRDYWVTRAKLERALGGSLAPLTPEEQPDSSSMAREALRIPSPH